MWNKSLAGGYCWRNYYLLRLKSRPLAHAMTDQIVTGQMGPHPALWICLFLGHYSIPLQQNLLPTKLYLKANIYELQLKRETGALPDLKWPWNAERALRASRNSMKSLPSKGYLRQGSKMVESWECPIFGKGSWPPSWLGSRRCYNHLIPDPTHASVYPGSFFRHLGFFRGCPSSSTMKSSMSGWGREELVLRSRGEPGLNEFRSYYVSGQWRVRRLPESNFFVSNVGGW